LGPLGTAATNRPFVLTPGDYDEGEIGGIMTGRGNRSTRKKPATVPLCPLQTPHDCPDANPGRRGGKPANNRLSYGTAQLNCFVKKYIRSRFYTSLEEEFLYTCILSTRERKVHLTF
jgi:hypothetical protein